MDLFYFDTYPSKNAAVFVLFLFPSSFFKLVVFPFEVDRLSVAMATREATKPPEIAQLRNSSFFRHCTTIGFWGFECMEKKNNKISNWRSRFPLTSPRQKNLRPALLHLVGRFLHEQAPEGACGEPPSVGSHTPQTGRSCYSFP